MHFHPLDLPDAMALTMAPTHDERGFFGRAFCAEEFAAAGLPSHFPQSNISFTIQKGTVRGMHYQRAPRAEPKVVRCTRGAIFDAIIDLRPDSPTYCRWAGLDLTAENRTALYVPPGFAHGFQTLSDETEVLYLMGEVYVPELATGVRWDDPAFGLSWPLPISVISERDTQFPTFTP